MQNASSCGVALPASFDERVIARRRLRACTAIVRTGTSPPARTPTARATAMSCCWPASCSTGPTTPMWRHRGARGSAPVAAVRQFSRTAATSRSAAAGATAACAFADERFLIFDCGPLGDGGHGHYDLLSVEVAAGGRPLARRPGPIHLLRGAAELAPLVQGHGGAQHRLVDGLDQTPYARRKPKGPVAAGAPAGSRHRAVARRGRGRDTSPVYDAVHSRAVLLRRPGIPGSSPIISKARSRTTISCGGTSRRRRASAPRFGPTALHASRRRA